MNTGLQSFSLEGKAVLITGAAGLLGTQHAIALAETGAMVFLSDIDEEGLKKAKATVTKFSRVDPEIVVMDITCEESIILAKEIVVQKSKQRNHVFKSLVNNAAVDHKVAENGIAKSMRLEDFDVEGWNKEVSVGLTGAVLCAKHFGPLLLESGAGIILNISSDLSVFSPDQRLYEKTGLSDSQQPVKSVSYPVIKTGLLGLTRYLATYWKNSNVRCNALSPGGVFVDQDEDFVQRLSNLIPLNRMATRDEYRAAVQFLCSDASGYMNGQNIVIDGGRSVL